MAAVTALALLMLAGCGLGPSNRVLPSDPPTTDPPVTAAMDSVSVDVGTGRAGTVTRDRNAAYTLTAYLT